MLKRFLEAGEIASTQGLKGEVRVNPWCDTPEFLTNFDGFYLDEGKAFLKADSVRVQKNVAIIKFQGVDSIDGAKRILKKVLFIDRNWVTLPEGAHFEQDLLGLEVRDALSGEIYGTLGEVGRTGANDIYRVDKNGRQEWIPAVSEIVKAVDIEGGVMLIKPIGGMFDDED